MPSLSALLPMIGLGLGAGVFGGMFGIGGGLIIVPVLILAFGFDQKTATGTSLLAQLLPVAILAVREFWKQGQVQVAQGLGIALGLVGGTLVGALITLRVPASSMKQAYGIFLIVVGTYFVFGANLTKPAPKAPPASETSTGSN